MTDKLTISHDLARESANSFYKKSGSSKRISPCSARYHCTIQFGDGRDMSDRELPRYAIFIRLGSFRLDVVGRAQIAITATAIAALLGARFYFF